MKYKLVTRTVAGELVSYAAENEASITYKENQWVEAPIWLAEEGYHPTVFGDKEALKYFREYSNCFSWQPNPSGNIELWEVDVEERVPLPRPNLLSAIRKGNLAPHSEGAIRDWTRYWPEGTEMYKRVRLIRRLNR